MPTMEQLDPSILYCMFKGEWGTRKSTAALSFPTPQYWASYDRKMNSLLIPMKNFGISPKDITFDDYKDYDGLLKRLELFQTSCPYKTVVLDSFSSLGDAILRQTMSKKPMTVRASGKEGGKMVGGIQVTEIEDFNAEASALQETMSLLKDINTSFGVHVVMIAHVITVESKDLQGITHTARSIVTAGKKVAHKLPAYCEEVYHFNVEQDKYTILTTHTGYDFARTSLPLERKIYFNDEPLFTNYLKPAIEKLKNMPTANITRF